MNKEYVNALILYSLAYIYCFHFAAKIENIRSGVIGQINNVHTSCIQSCLPSNKICNKFSNLKGKKYYTNSRDETKNTEVHKCYSTFYNFTHFLLYFLLGIFSPNCFKETLAIGIAFELIEREYFHCEDVLDILYNTMGFICGKYSRLYFKVLM